ncbi:MAG TPA: hypothetical protein VGJ53_10895 [Micromonosporaceae bacterium]
MSNHPPPNSDPLVVAALELLRPFYIKDRRDALTILHYWARFAELSPAQVLLILNHYPSRGDRPGGAR